ncbi:O-methyltransferase [Paracoccus aminophilus]|uniref:O-methyltransferase n=1 Tax=Paracoccus aminophilus JCM 7686 TaxID=1367847 RepID=S5Y0N8_PARAH|nr:O-methyltransferase [Paracoccus aminophilus]AGT09290.1 O-methyltransferase [Paracoccus aminophilus JCM 7686]
MRQPDYPGRDSEDWARVDGYFSDLLAPADPVLAEVLATNAAAGLPAHDVSAMQGKMLALLVPLTGARRVLEIGTLGGYSTIWMARALPEGGAITTIEANAHHAEIARANLARAGLRARVDLREGPALEVLPELEGHFDLIFIDADKPNNPAYLEWAMTLSRPGTLLIGDNVVRGGAVTQGDSADANVQGVRRFLEMIAADPRLEATALQTVGEKGWDGFVMAVVRG